MNKFFYQPINDPSTVNHSMKKFEQMVDGESHLSLQWLAENNWCATPVPDTFNLMDSEWISEAAAKLGSTVGICALTDKGQENSIFRIAFSQDAILKFDRDYSLMNYVMTSDTCQFAIMKEASNYFVVSGPKPFVREAIGCSFATAKSMFSDYATEPALPQKVSEYLMSVAERYEPFCNS